MSLQSTLVETTTTLLWSCFLLLDLCLYLPYQLLRFIARPRVTKELSLKTVVIAGASFAGLAAWRELRHFNQRHGTHFRILLLDQKDYFEYVPGVLRLFCQPHLFRKLAKTLSFHEGFVQGRVMTLSSSHVTYMTSPSVRKTIPFDYLILATGSSYSYPITASPISGTTLPARAAGWQQAAERVRLASSILILGGGAVGTELAAEIVDHFPNSKSVTLVEGTSTLLSLFPRSTSSYAERWLRHRGVQLMLGRKLQSWDDTSCCLEDGTVLRADCVFVCFGGTPNSIMMIKSQNGIDSRAKSDAVAKKSQCVPVDAYLRASTSNVFCCGDVASPPTEGLKQAFHAEAMGHLAAENVIRLCTGQFPLHRYPEDLTGGVNKMPFVTVLSLGRYDGVIGFNSLTIPGPLSAVLKWIIEWTKIEQMQGKPLGNLIWLVGDTVAYFISGNLLRPLSRTD
ncbi:hypothetical protein FisN_26Hu167 [Fistulifera solaris]|uniref:FAD/NAD(P)-binding domain-containing protein n=1 Tax=Fistulifera solaris TaxID=1519565 RepID=A0A1Z5JXV9_FISSO|nr:hypothetical protein FisN_26Hu167 [Fistulifera solaris]|eukprot:GAX18865.1 hypothetical protein FisN_26Hu167 [Fistulifera solaris]